MSAWRLAESLTRLRNQVNTHYPRRKKHMDGTIGDARHQKSGRSSDHNPWVRDGGRGVVTALDLTHDPANGFNSHAFAEFLRTQKDPRIKYVISHKRIFSSSTNPWQWRPYRGSNPHSAHMHVSVGSSKVLYDDNRPWTLPSRGHEPSEPSPAPEPVEPNADLPVGRPVLRQGSTGDWVRVVQRLLLVPMGDGQFGPITAAAVRAFQRGVDLAADGMVGPDTWAALDELEQLPRNDKWFRDIVATEFGGPGDANKSAYENRYITTSELGLALPFRFEKNERPQVIVENAENGKQVVCQVVDIGPWNTQDPYWQTGARPQAESGKDMRGRKTNLAGIDLTPAAARAIGLKGKGKVHWSFVETEDEGAA